MSVPVPVDLCELSALRYAFAERAVDATQEWKRLLFVRFRGTYRIGSAGNPDAAFMEAVVRMGCAAFHPVGVVLDLTELDYRGGDMIGSVLEAAAVDGSPCVVVAGEACREAMTSYVAQEMLDDPSWWLFADGAAAVAALQRRLEDDSLARALISTQELSGPTPRRLIADGRFRRRVIELRSEGRRPGLALGRALLEAESRCSDADRFIVGSLAKDLLMRAEEAALPAVLSVVERDLETAEALVRDDPFPTALLDRLLAVLDSVPRDAAADSLRDSLSRSRERRRLGLAAASAALASSGRGREGR
jgi:hypothetical protein